MPTPSQADPVDASTDVGMVRILLNDIDPTDFVFTDGELTALLALEGGSVKRAAAQAIDTNATNLALATRVLKTQDLTTDGAKLADAMRKHADRLRAQADVQDADDGFYFAIVETGRSCPELTERPWH